MPVYTYRCSNCGVEFDHQQKFYESNLTRCPECGKHELKRVYRPVGVVFKGSGFYVTDNRSSSASSLPPSTKDKEVETKKSEDKSKEKSAGKASDTSTSETKKAKKE